MYCIECGAKIPDNSKFCPHCGNKQSEGEVSLKEKIADVIIEKEITRQLIEEHNFSLNKEFLKKSMGWYLAWVLLNLGLLLIVGHHILSKNAGINNFYPFGYSHLDDYDLREFVVYTMFPLVILIVWSMVHKQKLDTTTIEIVDTQETEKIVETGDTLFTEAVISILIFVAIIGFTLFLINH
jgi:hypothetical protein